MGTKKKDEKGEKREAKEIREKWYHRGSGRIVLFRQFEIGAGDSNYIWIDNDKGFEAGAYRVEIYRVDEALTLLSSGEYRVDA